MKKILEAVKVYIIPGMKISSGIYISAYITKSFIIWKLENPFKWIVSVSDYEPEIRAAIFFAYALYWFIFIVVKEQQVGNKKAIQSDYKLYCERCDKDTNQKFIDSGHERDSSHDRFECLECGHIKYGL